MANRTYAATAIPAVGTTNHQPHGKCQTPNHGWVQVLWTQAFRFTGAAAQHALVPLIVTCTYKATSAILKTGLDFMQSPVLLH